MGDFWPPGQVSKAPDRLPDLVSISIGPIGNQLRGHFKDIRNLHLK
jgi:hypothetical protein